MSSSRIFNFPPGPNTGSSIARYSDIVVGYAIEGNDRVVMRIYGSLITSERITTKSLITEPGGALLSDQTLTNLAPPTGPTDAANKEYVDNVASSGGLVIKDPVKAGTTANILLSGIQIIDGYSTVAGDRILVKNQTLGVENGLYDVAVGAWTRTSDLPIGSSASRTTVLIEEGTTNKNSTWICTNNPPTDITGTDPLTFVLFVAGGSSLIPGDGLSQSGNILNVNVDNIGIEINGLNVLQIKLGGITNADLQNSTITINTTDGVAGGAVVPLGSNVNLSSDSTVVRTSGLQTINDSKSFNDPIILMVGLNGISLTAPALLASPYAFTFPLDGGIAGQVLTTDGLGTTSWNNTIGTGDVIGPASATDTAIAIYNGATGKVIKNSVVLIDPTGNVTGVQNLTVNGTLTTTSLIVGTEPIIGQRIFSGYDSVGLINITNTYQTLAINTNTVSDTGYSNASGLVTITDIGTYDVFYHAQFQTLNNSAGIYSTINTRLELDTGSGFNTIAGSGSSCYIIEQNGNLISPGTGKEVIINITVPGSVLRVTFARTTGTATGRIKPGESSLIIKRLRS